MGASFGLAFLAGILSVVAPCVLPLGAAASEPATHPWRLPAGSTPACSERSPQFCWCRSASCCPGWRDRMMGLGKGLKAMLGLVLAMSGLGILFGLDKIVEMALVSASPDWITNLTTRF